MMIFKDNRFVFLSTVILSFILSFCHGVIMQIENGLIEGEKRFTSQNGKAYYSFRSIPYAKPPLRELRFMPAQPVDKWDGVLSTKIDSPKCVQTTDNQIVGQEDCLYLNVYTPQIFNTTKKTLPVMVWIHGGAFMYGNTEYDDAAPDYFLDQDIVFVSFNYRLGVFGFLSLDDLVAPGNNGLKDQSFALRWIRDNIKYFSGDPNHVTLMGQSAGAASVAHHLESPLSAGLFTAAILESGSSLCLWAFSRLGREAVNSIAASFGIDTNTTRGIIFGLQKLESMELEKVASDIQNKLLVSTNPRDGLIFAPVKEPNHKGAFFSGMSHEVLSAGRFSRVPVLLGYNSLELSFSLPEILRLFLMKYDQDPSSLVPFDMKIHSSTVKSSVGQEIKFQYFGLFPIALSNLNVLEFFSDDQFVRPIQQFVRLLSRYTTTYFYEFHYEGSLGGRLDRTTPGVGHTEELGYLFRKNITASESDDLTRRRMVKMWTNFIKFRNPTPEPDELLQNQIWLPVSPHIKQLDYMRIDSNLTMLADPKKKIMDFWTYLYNRYGQPPYDTY